MGAHLVPGFGVFIMSMGSFLVHLWLVVVVLAWICIIVGGLIDRG